MRQASSATRRLLLGLDSHGAVRAGVVRAIGVSMRWSLLVLHALVACGAEVASNTADAALEVSLQGGAFTFCNCHHGYGPGVDGNVVLHVRNPSPSIESLGVQRVTIRPVGGGEAPVDLWHVGKGRLSPDDGGDPNGSYFHLTIGGGEGTATEASSVAHFPAGSEGSLQLSFYIDLTQLPDEAPDYDATLMLDGGHALTLRDAVSFSIEDP